MLFRLWNHFSKFIPQKCAIRLTYSLAILWYDKAKIMINMVKIMQSVFIRQVITLTRLSAQIILENGGETYRAEDTVIFIGRSLGYDTEVLSFPTGIIITLADEENDMNTVVKRIKKRSCQFNRHTLGQRLVKENCGRC